MIKLLKPQRILLLGVLLFALNNSDIFAQKANKVPTCANSDFSAGDFTNWVGHTSIYNKTTIPESSINNNDPKYAYYNNIGIVPGRHTMIKAANPDPFTCGNVLTLPPGEKQCVRLGNGGLQPDGSSGVEWQIDYLNYTFSITPSNSLLIYKYAVVLQNPSKFGLQHTKAIRPRFIVNIKDATGKLIDSICGMKEDFADSTVIGYKNCSEKDAANLGGINGGDRGDFVYREWTTVGVDLRKFIGQNITIGFETWDCGGGGHFAYAYLMAKCDSLGIKAAECSDNGSVTLTAPDGFAYKWLPDGQTTQSINRKDAKAGDTVEVELSNYGGCKSRLKSVIAPLKSSTTANFIVNAVTVSVNTPISFTDSSYSIKTSDQSKLSIVAWHWDFGDTASSAYANSTHIYKKPGDYKVVLTIYNEDGCTDSIIKYVKVLSNPLAIEKPKNEANSDLFVVYPNPSNGLFSVKLKKESNATMQVIDMTGKVIKSAQLNRNERYILDLSNHTKGIYMIKMNGEQQGMQKIILK